METLVDTLTQDDVQNVGNQVPRYSGWKLIPTAVHVTALSGLETKYRDIADGNQGQGHQTQDPPQALETKYRDIADGNNMAAIFFAAVIPSWKPSTAI